jgi:hypothetical protein
MPIHWGANQSGMQAFKELGIIKSLLAKKLWNTAAYLACGIHYLFEKIGLHKQASNRILEPFMHMSVIVTATDWDNFLWLRDHKDAQPEIRELAQQVRTALENATYRVLEEDDMHLPGISRAERENLTLEDQITLSVARCAVVSYNTRTDEVDLDRAKRVYARLAASKNNPEDRFHASPFEHQLINISKEGKHKGWTHQDFKGNKYSGNIKGYVQYRQLMEKN